MAGGLSAGMLRAWSRRGPAAWLLWPISLLYGLLVRLRRRLYRSGALRSEHAGIPVLVVGNVVAGGAGKTPVVMAIVEHLRGRGLHPGVVSRGYGRRGGGCRQAGQDDDAAQVGDEPLLLARKTGVPVFVAARRIEAVRALRQAFPQTDVIVCDDGLQHLALRRDLELCVFDEGGAGNGMLLPAGPLREPWPRPVDLVLHAVPASPAPPGSRRLPVDPAPPAQHFALDRRLAAHALRADGSPIALDALRGRRLFALAGIARPQRFFDMLAEAGLALEGTLALPDHADPAAAGNDTGWRLALAGGALLLCTEKDAVKLWPACAEALAVPLALQFDPGFFPALDRLLDARLSCSAAPH